MENKTPIKTEDLLDMVFLSRGEAVKAFYQTAENSGFRAHVEGDIFRILDWVLELSPCSGGYFFQWRKSLFPLALPCNAGYK